MTITEIKDILLYNKKIWYNSKGVLTTTKNLYERAQEIPELKLEVLRFKDSRNLSLCLRNTLEEIPKCPYCGKDCRIDHNKTYRQTCGDRACYQRAHEQTMLEKYGNKYTFKVPEIQEKVKETFLEKWGVENAGQSQEIKEKRYKTCLKKYGSITPVGNKEIQRKIQKKNQEKFGGLSPFSNNRVQQKAKETMQERYGVKNALQVPEFCSKVTRTLYLFQDEYYNSSWEIAYKIYSEEVLQQKIVRNNKIRFPYIIGNQEYFYIPDFWNETTQELIEIKGPQFLDQDNNLHYLFLGTNNTEKQQLLEEKAKAKQKCMIKNNIKVLSDKEVNPMIDYVKEKYGKSYLRSFKVR